MPKSRMDRKRAKDHVETSSVQGGQVKKPRMEEGCAEMNCSYVSEDFLERLSGCWKNEQAFSDVARASLLKACLYHMMNSFVTGAQLLDKPFQCCILPDFITDENGFLESLKTELLRLKFYEKNNDLYQFHQSNDLKTFKSPCICALRSMLQTKCLPWLRSVTGIDLIDTIDMTCSKYEYTDTLLCHDDELEGRRIAFIYYLVPEWNQEDGGTLDLFHVDENGQPKDIAMSLVPVGNNFAFFEVNAVSFHQVSEVLSPTKVRLSINGWFHGPPATRPPPYKEEAPLLLSPIPASLEVLSEWVNPLYLDIGVQSQIQQQFETDSQIELPDFLLEEKYKMICEELQNYHMKSKWIVLGPPNKRHTHMAESGSTPPIAKSCLEFLLSEPFCRLLAHLTGLDLAENVIRPNIEQLGTEGELFADPVAISVGEKENVQSSEVSKEKAKDTTQDAQAASTNKGDKEGESQAQSSCSNGSETVNTKVDKYHVSSATTPSSSQGMATSSSAAGSVASCRGDVYHWQPGDYTLASDSDPDLGGYALDGVLYFCCEGWSPDFGGMTSYIATDEDEELLSISPVPNAISLVYRDQDSLCFTKYINHRAPDPTDSSFFTVALLYKEN